jgi:tRNA G18 (ribose-2'-O)-methylase SpoU
MLGYKNSVNVATALGIVLFEALRARGALAGGVRGLLAG